MTFFNPLSGSLLPATPAQRASEKGRQIARSQALRKNTAAEGDRVEVEHQVESAEELPPAGEQSGGGGSKSRQQQQPRRQRPDPDADQAPPHIDLTA
jgi:hypothetical protein